MKQEVNSGNIERSKTSKTKTVDECMDSMGRDHIALSLLRAVTLLSSGYCCGEVMGRRRRRRWRRRESGFKEEEVLSFIQERLREAGGKLGELN